MFKDQRISIHLHLLHELFYQQTDFHLHSTCNHHYLTVWQQFSFSPLELHQKHCHLIKPNLHYTRDITPQRVTRGGAHLRDVAPEQLTPKKRRSGGEPLTTLHSIWPGQETNPRPPAPLAIFSNAVPTDRYTVIGEGNLFPDLYHRLQEPFTLVKKHS